MAFAERYKKGSENQSAKPNIFEQEPGGQVIVLSLCQFAVSEMNKTFCVQSIGIACLVYEIYCREVSCL